MQTLRRTAPILLAFSVVALAACAMVATGPTAQPTPAVTAESVRWTEPPKGFLPAGAWPDGLRIVPPPPAPDSVQGRAERVNYEATRALKDTPRWAQAARDDDLSEKGALHGFACAAGVRIGSETTPALAKMLLKTIDDARPVYNPAKKFYARKRPAAGNSAPICVPRGDWIETNFAYPSGHSTIGYSWALILAELVPERATEIAARGREFGDSRVICGVHWPSDVEAGRTLAGALVARLHAEPGFVAELAKAKAEVEAARGLGGPEGCGA